MSDSRILTNIRIRKICLKDFRNIAYAEIDMPGGKMSEYINGEPSIVGVYGQNGSGKTSLIMAISALKDVLSGSELLFSYYASCIRSGCDSCKLDFEFSAYNDKGTQFDLYYSFKMAIEIGETDNTGFSNTISTALNFMDLDGIVTENGIDRFSSFMMPKDRRIVVFDEVLQFAAQSADGEKKSKQVLIDTTEAARRLTGKTFGNKKKYEQLTSNCETGIDEYLLKAKLEAEIKSKSFIFSNKVLKTLAEGSSVLSYKVILKSLKEFGDNYLFTIGMRETATISSNTILLLSVWLENKDGDPIGLTFPLNAYKPITISEEFYPFIEYVFKSINQVITRIVPGLSIEIEENGKTVLESGENALTFSLLSVRNGVRIPFSYEADGIRRMVSFLSVLIGVYNNPSVTLAIDEMDAGIFEYMLGELLSIMNESAKGQLIFTSHNLRPLEVLPYKNLLFTTINPEKRFTRLEGISGNNNLRDSYFRSIILGSGKDAFYDATDTFSIEQAFFEAGLPWE